MKMYLKTIAASLLVISFVINNSFAQDIAKIEKVIVNTNVISDADVTLTDPGNTKIAGKFAAMFPAAQNQLWATDSKGSAVSFINEGRKTRAGFNTNGQVNYVIVDCNLEQLTTVFKNFIQTNYAGYQLLNGMDITSNGEHSQQAILQNATGYITLQATDDGIAEIKKINKSN